MRAGLVALCGFAASLSAQSQQDPKDLLLAVRRKVMETVGKLPRYMCTQTIDRAQYQPLDELHILDCDGLSAQRKTGQQKQRLSESDRLRLDVAVGATNEIYSWVGEDRFDDRSLFDLVGQGAVQTGSFRNFLSSIFGTDAASFSYNGDVTNAGRTMLEFGYRIPLEKSNYLFGNRNRHVLSAYEGTFLVDPVALDLVHLTVTTSQLPSEVGSCQATTILDYARVRLNDADFLLPTEARLQILNIDGVENDNRTVFSSCHEFVGKSKLSFDEPDPAGPGLSSETAPAGGFAWPPDRRFTLVFTQPIDTATAAAGDPIRAKLTTAIHDGASRMLAKNGAPVTARIVKLQHFYGASSSSVVLAVKLEAVESAGMARPISAALYTTTARFTKDSTNDKRGLSRRIDLGSLDTMEDRTIGVFEFRDAKANYVIKDGMDSTWVTLSSAPPTASPAP